MFLWNTSCLVVKILSCSLIKTIDHPNSWCMLKVRSRDITACFSICFLPDRKEFIQGRFVDSPKGITSFLPFVHCLGLFGIRLISFLSFVLCPVFLTFCTGTGVLCLWNWLEMLTSFFLVVKQPGKLTCFSWQWILWSSDFLRLFLSSDFLTCSLLSLAQDSLYGWLLVHVAVVLCCSLSCLFEFCTRRFQFKKWKALMMLSSRDLRFSSKIALYAEKDLSTS